MWVCFYVYAGPHSDSSASNEPGPELRKSDTSFSELGPLKENERRDLNCAVKEYLLLAGYRLTAMTFYEEVILKRFTHMSLIASKYKDNEMEILPSWFMWVMRNCFKFD